MGRIEKICAAHLGSQNLKFWRGFTIKPNFVVFKL